MYRGEWTDLRVIWPRNVSWRAGQILGSYAPELCRGEQDRSQSHKVTKQVGERGTVLVVISTRNVSGRVGQILGSYAPEMCRGEQDRSWGHMPPKCVVESRTDLRVI